LNWRFATALTWIPSAPGAAADCDRGADIFACRRSVCVLLVVLRPQLGVIAIPAQQIFLKLSWIEGSKLGFRRHRMAANVVSAD
jgi:hypothetical protein